MEACDDHDQLPEHRFQNRRLGSDEDVRCCFSGLVGQRNRNGKRADRGVDESGVYFQ